MTGLRSFHNCLAAAVAALPPPFSGDCLMAHRKGQPFAPVTGFMPGDGDEPGVEMSRDNPVAPAALLAFDAGDGAGPSIETPQQALDNATSLAARALGGQDAEPDAMLGALARFDALSRAGLLKLVS